MRTPCAFHPGHLIAQFCKCQSCLLPLCSQCIAIHKQQHPISDPINLTSIQSIVSQIRNSITSQFKYVDTITVETINKYRESDQQHKRVFQQILHHKDIVMNSIQNIYQNIIIQLDQNAKRREIWIRQFNQSVLQLKQQLTSLINSLVGEKYLRTVIMWNRMKPNEAIQQITKKAEKKWLVPTFSAMTAENLINYITNNTNLKVLEIEGDSGVKKILHIIRVLRYGEPQHSSPNSSQKSFQFAEQKSLPPKPVPQSLHLQKQPALLPVPNSQLNQISNIQQKYPSLASPLNSPTSNMQSNSLYFNSPNRKTSSKKIQVLSSLQFYKSTSQVIDHIK